jgi:hypothetical protein
LGVEAVHKELAVHAAPKWFGVARTTLRRHLDDHKRCGNEQFFYGNKCAVWTAFSAEQNGKLTDCVTAAGRLHYGLTRKEVMKLAYQFAKELAKEHHNSWDVNGRAGELWVTEVKRNKCRFTEKASSHWPG